MYAAATDTSAIHARQRQILANALMFLAGIVLAGEQLAGYFLAGDA